MIRLPGQYHVKQGLFVQLGNSTYTAQILLNGDDHNLFFHPCSEINGHVGGKMKTRLKKLSVITSSPDEGM